MGEDHRKKEQKEEKDKAPESTHVIVAHCNVGVVMFNASFATWRHTLMLDIGATHHMIFRKDFFKN